MKTRMLTIGLILAICAGALPALAQEEIDHDRVARWKDLARSIFPGKTMLDGGSVVAIDAPPRALDAALVPVTVTTTGPQRIEAIYLIVDDNPAPLAAAIHFGPAGDAHLLTTRIRVNQYTLLHAVAVTTDGKYYDIARFVKAAGGCSAPATGDEAQALARIGRMKFRLNAAPVPGAPVTAQLLISHPNANGMQMDPVTRTYTPARYVQTVTVSEGGKLVFRLEGDISLSQDPAFTFGLVPDGSSPVNVRVEDSKKTVFERSFPLGQQAG
jgi:sulfur-oxidizing protein SoxY